MTDAERVLDTLARFGPLSDYGILHASRAAGHKMTPSSARSRRAELVRRGLVEEVKGLTERSRTGYRAKVWKVVSA